MKLQFAFGNPRRKKKRAKSVAKRRKKAKNKSVKHKKGGVVAKRRKIFSKKRKFGKRRKNPEASLVRKNGKIIGREYSPLNRHEANAVEGKAKSLLAKYKSAPLGPEKNRILRELIGMKKQLSKRSSYLKAIQRYQEDGANVTSFETKKQEKKVAKKRKKKKSKKVKAKALKSAGKVKRTKKRKSAKRKSRKSAKRRAKKVAKHTAVAHKAKRKTRRSSKRKGAKRRRRARMITHKHASSMRHIKKGTSFRFKTTARKGKRKISVTGRVKVNPYRRNPMKALSAQSKKYLGIEAAELTALAVGGLTVPVINSLAGKYMPGVVSKINEFVGPQAVGSVLPILGGVLLNAAAEHGVKNGKAHDALKIAGEGLAAAGIIGLAMSLSQKFVAPVLGLAGINYTPSMGIMPTMNGINYTPSMRGINYTPKQMGIMPQLNGMGSVDFGAPNYGSGGSKEARTQRSDFGANFSEDSEAEGLSDEDNSYSQSMN